MRERMRERERERALQLFSWLLHPQSVIIQKERERCSFFPGSLILKVSSFRERESAAAFFLAPSSSKCHHSERERERERERALQLFSWLPHPPSVIIQRERELQLFSWLPHPQSVIIQRERESAAAFFLAPSPSKCHHSERERERERC